MKVLLDLVPLKRGGGVQVGLSLVDQLERSRGMGHKWYAMVSAGSALDERLASAKHCRVVARVKNSVLARLRFETVDFKRLVKHYKPDIIYTQFGPGMPRTGVPTVVGSAYSNLYYPELDFWGNWPLFHRLLYRLRDVYRLRRTLRADALVFETDQIAKRAVTIFGWPEERLAVVRPSPSLLVHPNASNDDVARRCQSLPKGFRVLLLTGWHMNKGLNLLPNVAAELKRQGTDDVYFVITVPASDPRSRDLHEEAARCGVEENIVFFGAVDHSGCVELYRHTDAVMLLSVLESFSNNIIEAWMMRRPLIITDADWSRALCADGAAYVDRADRKAIAAELLQLRRDERYRERLVVRGEQMLCQYPDPSAKCEQYVRFLERIYELGPRMKTGRVSCQEDVVVLP